MVGPREHGTENSDYIKGGKSVEQLSVSQEGLLHEVIINK
jgi:hypothetical protein